MTTTAIRERLYDFIRIADDKKVKAIYMMLEDEVITETQWWKDHVFTAQLDKEFEDWNSGKSKSYTMADIDASISQLKKKRK